MWILQSLLQLRSLQLRRRVFLMLPQFSAVQCVGSVADLPQRREISLLPSTSVQIFSEKEVVKYTENLLFEVDWLLAAKQGAVTSCPPGWHAPPVCRRPGPPPGARIMTASRVAAPSQRPTSAVAPLSAAAWSSGEKRQAITTCIISNCCIASKAWGDKSHRATEMKDKLQVCRQFTVHRALVCYRAALQWCDSLSYTNTKPEIIHNIHSTSVNIHIYF